RHGAEARPVELDVLPRGEVAVTAVISARDMGELAQLPRGQRTIGHGDTQHIGVQLQIEPVHQPQRPELVLAELAAEAPAHLVGKLRGAARYESRVEFVISIHARPHPGAGGPMPVRWRRAAPWGPPP